MMFALALCGKNATHALQHYSRLLLVSHELSIVVSFDAQNFLWDIRRLRARGWPARVDGRKRSWSLITWPSCNPRSRSRLDLVLFICVDGRSIRGGQATASSSASRRRKASRPTADPGRPGHGVYGASAPRGGRGLARLILSRQQRGGRRGRRDGRRWFNLSYPVTDDGDGDCRTTAGAAASLTTAAAAVTNAAGDDATDDADGRTERRINRMSKTDDG